MTSRTHRVHISQPRASIAQIKAQKEAQIKAENDRLNQLCLQYRNRVNGKNYSSISNINYNGQCYFYQITEADGAVYQVSRFIGPLINWGEISKHWGASTILEWAATTFSQSCIECENYDRGISKNAQGYNRLDSVKLIKESPLKPLIQANEDSKKQIELLNNQIKVLSDQLKQKDQSTNQLSTTNTQLNDKLTELQKNVGILICLLK